MKYISSRGAETGLSFEQVLFSGYAKDGGLYFPETIPKIDIETLKTWKNLKYPEIVRNVMQMYIGEDEVPTEDLKRLLENAFSKFESSEEPIPISRLKSGLSGHYRFQINDLGGVLMADVVVARSQRPSREHVIL